MRKYIVINEYNRIEYTTNNYFKAWQFRKEVECNSTTKYYIYKLMD